MADEAQFTTICGTPDEAGRTLVARVDPLGAQLMSLAFDGREYLWQGDERWWPRRAPVLFPIVGSLRPGTVSAEGPLSMGRHGVARTREFCVVDVREHAVTLELRSDEETRAAFPYAFCLHITYTVEGTSTLRQTFEVLNTGGAVLPFTLGGHPAFNVPLGEGERFEDYELRFAKPWTVSSPTMVDGGLWDFSHRVPVLSNADRLPLSHRLFDVDTLLLEGVPERRAELVGPQGHGVRVAFGGFPYLGLWSAAGDAPFVAIEPWCGCSTALDEGVRFENKRAMTLLAPGYIEACSFTIEVF